MQGIAMFLAGGFSRLAIDARAAGDEGRAYSFGAAAAAMVFLFTSVFGATWLTGVYPTPFKPHNCIRINYISSAMDLSRRDLSPSSTSPRKRVGCSRVEHRQWLASKCPAPPRASLQKILYSKSNTNILKKIDSPLPGNVQLNRRKDPLRLRSQQRDRHPHGVGALSGEQPAHTGRHGPAVCGGYTVGVGCGEDICAIEGGESRPCGGCKSE